MTTLLWDLIEIPDRALAGDFAPALGKSVGENSNIGQYQLPIRPMPQDLHLLPRLDRLTIGVIPGDAEQLVVPSAFAAVSGTRRAS